MILIFIEISTTAICNYLAYVLMIVVNGQTIELCHWIKTNGHCNVHDFDIQIEFVQTNLIQFYDNNINSVNCH